MRESIDFLRKHPAAAGLEIAWRWMWGSTSFILAFVATKAFLAGISVSDAQAEALRGFDLPRKAQAIAELLAQGGMAERVLATLVIVLVPTTAFWVLCATVGRDLVLRQLIPERRASFGAILSQNIARACLLWSALLGWFLWMVVCAMVAGVSGPVASTGGMLLYLFLAFAAMPFIFGLWGWLNWVLSLVPLIAAMEGTGATQAFRSTVKVSRARRKEFWKASGAWGIPRLIAMMALLALMSIAVVLPVSAGITFTVVLSLLYCAIADGLYVARLHAYLQIVKPVAASAANRVV